MITSDLWPNQPVQYGLAGQLTTFLIILLSLISDEFTFTQIAHFQFIITISAGPMNHIFIVVTI